VAAKTGIEATHRTETVLKAIMTKSIDHLEDPMLGPPGSEARHDMQNAESIHSLADQRGQYSKWNEGSILVLDFCGH
jgi:hypothetical protein